MSEPARRPPRHATVAALAVLYLVWGSTYLAQRVALESVTPLQLGASRFLVAGSLLYAVARLGGARAPTGRELGAALLAALPLLVLGMGAAAFALRRVPSGLGALVFGAVPLVATLIDGLGVERRAPSARELCGLALGGGGVALAAARGGLRADPGGAALLCLAALCYAVGAVATKRLPLPPGLVAPASQMVMAGGVFALASALSGETPTVPTPRALVALAHLVLPGSVVAYAAFAFLVRTERPSLATSYAFVNPLVAIGLGAALGREIVRPADLLALGLVLAAVWLVVVRGGVTARATRA